MVYAAARPALHWDATFEETLSDTSVRSWPLHVGRSFSDVPSTRGDYRYVETVLHRGHHVRLRRDVFCPDATSRGRRWPSSSCGPSTARPTYLPRRRARLRRRARRSVRGGLDRAARRRGHHGRLRQRSELLPERSGDPGADGGLPPEDGARSSWVPPAASGDFTDVPVANPFAPWVEALKDEGVTAGCGTGYCPTRRRGAARWRSS